MKKLTFISISIIMHFMPAMADTTEWCTFPNVKKKWSACFLYICVDRYGSCTDAWCDKRYGFGNDTSRIDTSQGESYPKVASDGTFRYFPKCWNWRCKSDYYFESASQKCLTKQECMQMKDAQGVSYEVNEASKSCSATAWCSGWSSKWNASIHEIKMNGGCKQFRCKKSSGNRDACFPSANQFTCDVVETKNKSLVRTEKEAVMQVNGWYVESSSGICKQCGPEQFVKGESCADVGKLTLGNLVKCYKCADSPDYMICTGADKNKSKADIESAVCKGEMPVNTVITEENSCAFIGGVWASGTCRCPSSKTWRYDAATGEGSCTTAS